MTAFLTLEIRQGSGHEVVAEHLATIPEVLEAYTITGAGDMWAGWWRGPTPTCSGSSTPCSSDPGIVRSSTVIALATQIPHRVLPLLEEAAAAEAQHGPSTGPEQV